MPDVKKLITGFLILAAGAGSSALVLSSIGSSSATNSPSLAVTSSTSSTGFGTNAFAVSPSAEAATADADAVASSTAAAMADPNNLTAALADSYLNGLVAVNPNGVETNTDGSPDITPPDNTSVINSFGGVKALSDLSVPNWDIEVANQAIHVTSSSSPTDIANYANALQAVFNHDFVQTGFAAMAESGSEPSDATGVSQSIDNALQGIGNLSTPAPAAAFQRSLVKLLIYEKNTLALANNTTNDPVKNALIIQGEEQNYNAAIQNVQGEMEKLSAVSGFSFGATQNSPTNRAVALLDNAFGIQTAHAIFGFGDITFDPAVFGQWLLKFAEDTALQIVKNALVMIIQQKVLAWVRGSGAPRFIQNWATTVVNAYQQTALNYLNSQMQCINPAFAPQIKLTLGAYYQTGINSCSAQFQSQLNNNLNSFYNKFSSGGFIAFGQTLLPTNNFYGQLFFTAQAANAAGSNQQLATYGQSVASQGFTGSNVCGDGSNPNGSSPACVNNNNGSDVIYPTGNSCPAGYTLKPTPNNGVCGNGNQPLIATPGTVTAQGFGVALDTSPKLVTAASTIAGLLSSLTASLLNTLAQAAITYSNQTVSGALQGGNSGSGGSAPQDGGIISLPAASTTVAVGSLPSQPGVTCAPAALTLSLDPTTGQAPASFYASGGATDINCAVDSSQCGANENSDGSPTYTWSAPGALNTGGGTNSSAPFTATFTAPGNYNVSVTASTDNSSSTCQVVVTAATSSSTTNSATQ